MIRFEDKFRRRFENDAHSYRMLSKKADARLLEIKKMVEEYEKHMLKMIYTAECADETLCHVLLAIRQNEYLQAWYPEKKGNKK